MQFFHRLNGKENCVVLIALDQVSLVLVAFIVVLWKKHCHLVSQTREVQMLDICMYLRYPTSPMAS